MQFTKYKTNLEDGIAHHSSISTSVRRNEYAMKYIAGNIKNHLTKTTSDIKTTTKIITNKTPL